MNHGTAIGVKSHMIMSIFRFTSIFNIEIVPEAIMDGKMVTTFATTI